MKTIIAGSRHFNGPWLYNLFEQCPWVITEVVSGTAAGVDTAGEFWAKQRGLPLTMFRPDWNVHGAAAGPIRNKDMFEYCEAGIIVWDGISKGAKNMYRHFYGGDKPYQIWSFQARQGGNL